MNVRNGAQSRGVGVPLRLYCRSFSRVYDAVSRGLEGRGGWRLTFGIVGVCREFVCVFGDVISRIGCMMKFVSFE